MDPRHPLFEVQLPAERPVFEVPGLGARPVDVDTRLYQVTIDLEQRALALIWCGRHPLKRSLAQKTLNALESSISTTLKYG
jgi:hypothetical protein